MIYDYHGNRLPFYCLSPKGEVVDPAVIPPGYQLRSGFTGQARLVQFKMPLKEPDRYAGTWKVIIQHKGMVCKGSPNRQAKEPGFLPRDCKQGVKEPLLYGIAIGVGSDFRMLPFVTPAPVYVGDPILLTALVAEAGLPVKGCTVTVEATAPGGMSYNITLMDDGLHSDGEVADGEYARPFTQTFVPGIYHFKFQAVGYNRDGQPVMREAVRDKPVLEHNRPGDTGTIHDPKDPPKDGEQPPQPDCCSKIVRELQKQNELLRRLLGQRTGSLSTKEMDGEQ